MQQILPEKRKYLWGRIVGNHDHPAKRKKPQSCWNVSQTHQKPWSVWFGGPSGSEI